MKYEWDISKANSNRRKHGVEFADAVAVFEDDCAIQTEDDFPHEQRFITIGIDGFAHILVVIYTWREDTIRIISARKATNHERRDYEG